MKIRKIISTKVYKRFKLSVTLFFGLFAMNYLANTGVTDLISNFAADENDMSDYGIFVNADGDMIEQGEEELRQSTDFLDYDFEEDHRQLAEIKANNPKRSANAEDPATGSSMCLKIDKNEAQPGEVQSSYVKERWYCWTGCDDREATKFADPARCPPQYMLWPPSFCKKGSSPNCVGPYMQRKRWKFNEIYDNLRPAVGANRNYFPDEMTYEIGYDWTKAKKYRNMMLQTQPFGYVEYYYGTSNASDQACYKPFVLLQGIQLNSPAVLFVAYLLSLCYLFLGIAIVSDIFMEAIEVITAQTKQIQLYSKDGKSVHKIDVPKWNETVANLTLMALGSSAPEILLSTIETLKNLDGVPSVIGASTIVGSAAFNLLVISGLSILAVEQTDEVPYKKINQYGVFFVTSFFSLWAYIWLLLVLQIISKDKVTIVEAYITLVFCVLLIIIAFAADKMTTFCQDQKKSLEQVEEDQKKDEQKIKKGDLRNIAKIYGDNTVVEIAQGITTDLTVECPKHVHEDIIILYKDILEVDDLKQVDINILLETLQAESLLERFAYRKANRSNNNEFIKLKGTVGQIQKDTSEQVKSPNQYVGFKCLHYQVTESSGVVEITIVKKCPGEITVGYRTVADTAFAPKDFGHVDETITFAPKENEKKILVPIVDDDEWEPDLDFFVELYDPTKTPPVPQYHGEPIDGVATFTDNKVIEKSVDRLEGDDTITKITILDEDFPGKLGFESTDITVKKADKKVEIIIKRFDGSDGKISCMIRTEQLVDQGSNNNAVEFEDYLPREERVNFQHQEQEKIISIDLVNNEHLPVTKKDEDEDDDSEGEPDVMFKVKLEKPEPAGVKISKKNVCLVTISKSEEIDQEEEDKKKLIEYFLSQKDVTWMSQFRSAITLGPVITEDDMILEDVTLFQALWQFCAIFWRLLFATIPPPNYWGGYGCFVVSLIYIGLVTALVGDMAILLGCEIGLRESVTAITIVALGTSLPDTFASMTAARTSEFADSAIGNITGSNSVNVFLGLGVPWAIATTYWQAKYGTDYTVPAGEIAFSVFVFLIVAICCFIILILRRVAIGGELGGPKTSRYASAILCMFLWFLYILFSTLQAYQIIEFNLDF